MIGRQQLGKSPTPLVFPQSNGAITIRNVGHVTIWIDEDKGIEPFSGIELAVGEQATVAASIPLYGAFLDYSATAALNIGGTPIAAVPPFAIVSYHLSAVGA